MVAIQNVQVGDQLKFQDQFGHHCMVELQPLAKCMLDILFFLAASQYYKTWDQSLTYNALIIKNRRHNSLSLDHLLTGLNNQSATQGVIRSDAVKDAIKYILDGLNNLILIIITISFSCSLHFN